MSTWREGMCDLAAYVWTARKASPTDVREDIRKAIGVVVPVEQEDALAKLLDNEIREVLKELKPSGDDVEGTDLCPECFSMPGECEEDCGQREPPEEDPRVDLPETEDGMVKLVDEALYAWFDEYLGKHPRWETRTFEEAQIMTQNKGLVVKVGNREFQLTCVRSK